MSEQNIDTIKHNELLITENKALRKALYNADTKFTVLAERYNKDLNSLHQEHKIWVAFATAAISCNDVGCGSAENIADIMTEKYFKKFTKEVT